MQTFTFMFLAPLLAVCLCVGAAGAQTCAITPRHLRCEYLVNPEGIDEQRPRLSWVLDHTHPATRGATQTAYQILVADTPALLARDQGNLWDTGKVASDESIQITYKGMPLRSRTRVFWKVRVWDGDDHASTWSEPARWSMGLRDDADWKAEWIGDATEPPPMMKAHNGYHSEFAATPDEGRWVIIELGESGALDAVKLFPARPYDWREDAPGLMFPVRFRIDVSETADFADFRTVVDRTGADVPNPGTEPLQCTFAPARAQFVRLMVTRLRMRDEGNYAVALAEMQVLSKGRNIAAGAKVTAQDSIETGPWAMANLTDGDLTSHAAGVMDSLPAPLLRREFRTGTRNAAITRATAYVTALGLYELSINGRRVGDHLLAPEWTDYHRRVQYQAYDVTDLIRHGDNALGAILGDGWYAGGIGLTFVVPGGPPRAIYGRLPKLLLQLEIEFADGSRQIVVSDGDWRSTPEGPIRTGDLLDGEICDARREMPGWDLPGFRDDSWTTVRAFDPPDIELVAQPNEPIRIVKEIKPIALAEPKPGVFVYDMGQNMVGWCRLAVRGETGTVVTLRHAEVLNPDGTIYTDNLRGADQTDRFTLRGGGSETFEPHFTYHGFRYVEVTGQEEKPALNALTGCVFHSAAPDAGRFECSSDLLNRLMANIVWTQRANMHSTPTDCPQRDERLGWMGDILAFSQAACFNLDMAAFFTKWIQDVRDAQAADGRYPDFAPQPFDSNKRFSGVPAWGDAGIVVPWRAYENYGDRRILEKHYDSARRWVEYVHEKNPDLLWKNSRGNDYGDWLNADTLKLEGWPTTGGQVPKEVFATAFFARSTELLSQMAAVIGRDDEARRYARLAEDIRDAFNAAYVQDDGMMSGDTQAGYALALHYDLLPEALRARAAKRMVDCFDRYDGHISTGFLSTTPLMFELCREGYSEEAYRLINKRTMPSWGYAIDHGATTIWERWDGYVEGRGFQDPGMNSFAHYAIGSVGEWMYRTILGINLDPEVPAYKRFIIRPRPGGGLTWARGHYDSIRGRIGCDWKLDGGRIMLNVTVPANTSATVYVPTVDPDSVREGGRPVREAHGVEYLGTEDGAAMFRVGSGDYRFTATTE
ncbi:MAG: glycoside hydrolase family 78 protein [Phycisphaerales bacterium]|nr:MAG: glycoside hydrolase family 78 protein [Phycisphaerales bacterium]